MKTYKRILAAVDFSSHAEVVARHAVALAQDLKAKLIFVNVVNSKDIDYIYQTSSRLQKNFNKSSIQKCIDQLYEERKIAMEELKKTIDLGKMKTQFIIKTGIPFRELLSTIAEENIDMLVMGIKGRSNLTDVMVGSTALKMFKRCPVSLVTVRKNNNGETD